MALTAEQRSIRASIGANTLHAGRDGREITANARASFLAKFLTEVNAATPGLPGAERQRRAQHLLAAHMKRLALASSTARTRKATS